MNFIINKFVILSLEEMKAFSSTFKEKMNLIIGEKDSGKSSLARSILYTLGCEVKNLDFIKKMPNNIYILDFQIGENSFILMRKSLKKGKGKNFFKIIKNNSEIKYFNNTSSFKEYLNEILNIKLITTDKNYNETKLYPNHIFLPFFIDQDYSWQDYLTSSFNGVAFIKDYKKIILEYFTGVHPNEFYELKLKKESLNNQKTELKALIKSKEMILVENNKSIKIIESIDVDSFKKQYIYYLNLHKNIIETQHELKKELNEKIYMKNSLLEMKTKLDTSIKNIIGSELDETCPNCHQKIFHDMEENYKLYLTEQNLIKEKEIIAMNIINLESEISEKMNNMKKIKVENNSLKEKLDSNSEAIKLKERAESYAFNKINESLITETSDLKKELNKIEKVLEVVEKDLRKLNKNDVSKSYNELMKNAFKKLKIPFEFRSYYNNNLESVEIFLSGASKVQAFIAQYLTIYKLAMKREKSVTIPMFIDTFLKDDFNDKDVEKTSKYILDVLKDTPQSFVFISNNNQTLDAIEGYKYHEIRLEGVNGLLSQNYDEVYQEYSKLLRE